MRLKYSQRCQFPWAINWPFLHGLLEPQGYTGSCCRFIVSHIRNSIEIISRKSYFEHLHLRNLIATIIIACPTEDASLCRDVRTHSKHSAILYRGHSCLLFKEEKETWQETRLCGTGNTHGLRHPPHCRLKWTVKNQSRELSESNSKGLTHKFMLKKMQI